MVVMVMVMVMGVVVVMVWCKVRLVWRWLVMRV